MAKTPPCGRPLEKPKSSKDTYLILESMRDRLEKYVIQNSLNRSDARDKILETIVSGSHHFTAQNLLPLLGAKYPEVGRATLYRNLPVLVDSGIIQEGPPDTDGQSTYELSTEGDHHDHIVCLDCKNIFEFHDDSIEKKQNTIANSMNFSVQDHRHVIYARCGYLKKKA